MITKEESLTYHSRGRKGKIEVVPTKPCSTQKDLSLAYTPGVAYACWEIERDPDLAYEYTAKGNLVAVISDGTAVLGLGNIGPLAGKPVMEGKGILFKRFADIDVFDLELNVRSVDDFIKIVKSMEPTFGGINLEDIKAPELFQEQRLLMPRVFRKKILKTSEWFFRAPAPLQFPARIIISGLASNGIIFYSSIVKALSLTVESKE
jgi:malate dehydrogenase (oxaloacetate-decarboxylating)(NADP+)